jgi:hypothetical protein
MMFSFSREKLEQGEIFKTNFPSVALAYWQTLAMSQFVNVKRTREEENLFDGGRVIWNIIDKLVTPATEGCGKQEGGKVFNKNRERQNKTASSHMFRVSTMSWKLLELHVTYRNLF